LPDLPDREGVPAVASDVPGTPRGGLDVNLELAHPRITVAFQQNDVQIVRRLVLTERDGSDRRNLRVRLFAEPDFAMPWEARVDHLRPGDTVVLEKIDLQLSPAYLFDLRERAAGVLVAEVDADAAVLAHARQPVELLARDEWDGSGPAEMLAAFVQPNDPAIEALLAQAARVLQRWTGDPSLNGYQSRDPRRVAFMAAAVFTALQDLDVTYVNPPASFESTGQKVRSPERLLEHRLGTCLDLAVLAAAGLEQCGLHTLVVLVKGHAFAGVWLVEETFADAAVDDAARLRNRVGLGELLLFDPTAVTARPRVEFATAIEAAKRRVESDAELVWALDVQRARLERIRPLPVRPTLATGVPQGGPAAAEVGAGVPVLPPEIARAESERRSTERVHEERETPRGRLERWKRKLLDLTRHNRLLHFRESKTTVQLLCPDVAALEDYLVGGAACRVGARPSMAEQSIRDLEAHVRRTGSDPLVDLLRDDLKRGRLYADLASTELDRRLLEVFRATRIDFEESGANTLYLALGFLRWFERGDSDQARWAPILLLPMQIERVSAREGFTIRQSDDEPRVNVTLLELLAHDFGLTVPCPDPLPLDESGLDVAGILRTFREAIRGQPRWDVEERATLARLSFAKFLLWRDLEQRSALLMQNRVVDHLINRPDRPFEPDAVFPDPDCLDEQRRPADVVCPCDADSSQLAAVLAAAEGRSFVLEGPPGTGKSQTITNLVAQCLSEGRTVLFVAEKAAALNVVKSRLQRVGLGDFCLELHSNKARKLDVVRHLGRALRAARERPPDEWERTAAQLEGVRGELNQYADALHRRRPLGESVYRVTDRLIGLQHAPRVALRWRSSDGVDATEYDRLRRLVADLASSAADAGHPAAHVWQAVGRDEWSLTWQREVEGAIDALADASRDAAAALEAGRRCLGLDHCTSGPGTPWLAAQIAGHLLASPHPHRGGLTDAGYEARAEQAPAWIAAGRRRDALHEDLRERYRDAALQLPIEDLRAALARAERVWFLPAWLARRRVRRALAGVACDGHDLATAQLATDLEQLAELTAQRAVVSAADDDARRLFGRHWNSGQPDWALLEAQLAWIAEARALAACAAGGDPQHEARLREQWSRLAADGAASADVGPARAELAALRDAVEALDGARARLVPLLELDEARAWGAADVPGWLARVRETLGAWRGATRDLAAWCAWRRARREAIGSGLEPLVDAYERGAVAADDLAAAFERGLREWWLTAVIDAEPALRHFRSAQHGRRIDEFRRLDRAIIELSTQLARARVAARLPAVTEAGSVNSEVGVLQRELQKQRRHLPVRRLIERMPHLLPRLAPCLLMSPLSVAQYLDAGVPAFDVVVFDEASQIPAWDAVGAIARGRSAVVVGDPKQLPPTNFFARVEDDDAYDDEATVVEDLESILDDCIASRLPALRLNWHYRSRHESLIAFSNHHYYDNRLLTFPAAHFEGLGVQWRNVPGGVYDKGRSRTNRGEADAVVAEVVRRLRDPNLRGHSIGVVTFAIAQQRLIEDLLDEARRQDPALEEFFTDAVGEPVFVKNLENVQGDERDVILFSICFGPDAAGKVSMNFGPLNRDGGERRLNVAVTRARREVLVFSTLRADQIDLARTRAKGAAHLKAFLEYAERGPETLKRLSQLDADAECESPFEQEVYDAVTARGWTLHRQVGCSGYRIDLAVVDPNAPGRYLLGIECDGANYHRAKTARDRDRLRALVLESLGWRLHRIWSTDWWMDPRREVERLVQALENARDTAAAPAPPPSIVPPEPAPVAIRDAHASPVTARRDLIPEVHADDRAPQPYASQSTAIRAGGDPQPLARYRPALVTVPRADTAQFFSGPIEPIRRHVEAVVRQEAPISLGLAARRVARAWNIERVTERAVARFADVAQTCSAVRLERIGLVTFLWPATVDPAAYRDFRTPGDGADGERPAEDLHPVEVANAAHYVLTRHVSLPLDDLVRETARLLGYQRLGRRVRDSMQRGVEHLVASGRARQAEDRIVLGD
jgi:very-short-patch-repair endonuclease